MSDRRIVNISFFVSLVLLVSLNVLYIWPLILLYSVVVEVMHSAALQATDTVFKRFALVDVNKNRDVCRVRVELVQASVASV